MKSLVANCAEKTGLVDTELLKSLTDQVELRLKIFKIQIRCADLDYGKTMEELKQDALIELTMTNPKAV